MSMPRLRLKLYELEQIMRFVNSEVEGVTVLTRMIRRGIPGEENSSLSSDPSRPVSDVSRPKSDVSKPKSESRPKSEPKSERSMMYMSRSSSDRLARSMMDSSEEYY